MFLSTLVQIVDRVRATPRKTEKVALLADLLRPARGREAELAALYLTGTLPQGRVGLGWRTLPAAMTGAPRQGDPLTLADVDHMAEAIAGERGAGSGERRTVALRALLADEGGSAV